MCDGEETFKKLTEENRILLEENRKLQEENAQLRKFPITIGVVLQKLSGV
jgi:hypothetical protein